MSGLLPLALDNNNWRSRWLAAGEWDALHRISSIEWNEPDEMISGSGIAVCGRQRQFHMPGIFSRMGLKRCPDCCVALGIPEGEGAPFNAFDGEYQNA